jgi:acetolactate synthase-1/2/3 large subunit
MKNVILIGAGCSRELADKLCSLGVPVLVTWQGIDLVPEDSPVFCGRPGMIGQRAANIIQQKADQVFIFGARMDGEQVGHRMDNFAPRARKVIYDIDDEELDKLPATWFQIKQDLHEPFLLPDIDEDKKWLAWCKALYKRFRKELDGAEVVDDYVDPYYFVRRLSDACQEGEIIVPSSSGMQSCAMMQAFKVKRGQRILLNNTTGAMGFEPMAIGAAMATGKRVVCVAGDGGFFLNMQELETVRREHLPIKYFVFCNGGYGSIVTMQDARFNLRVGAEPQSGFSLPDLARTAAVWSIPYHEINSNAQMDTIKRVLNADGPAIVRVNSSLAFRYACRVQAALKDNVFVVDDMADVTPKIIDLERLLK